MTLDFLVEICLWFSEIKRNKILIDFYDKQDVDIEVRAQLYNQQGYHHHLKEVSKLSRSRTHPPPVLLLLYLYSVPVMYQVPSRAES